MDIFSKPFATDALDREIKKQWAENNMRHQEKVRLLEECTDLDKIGSRTFAQQEAVTKYKYKKYQTCVLQGLFFVPFVFWPSEYISLRFREHKAIQLHFEVIPLKQKGEEKV